MSSKVAQRLAACDRGNAKVVAILAVLLVVGIFLVGGSEFMGEVNHVYTAHGRYIKGLTPP